jgi:hypothetical protein
MAETSSTASEVTESNDCEDEGAVGRAARDGSGLAFFAVIVALRRGCGHFAAVADG